MTLDQASRRDLVCPLCGGSFDTWRRDAVCIEFCTGCDAIFFDRGELYRIRRSEGDQAPPPDVYLLHGAQQREGRDLLCPKCATPTLAPATFDSLDFWLCRPCNGILVLQESVFELPEATPADLGFEWYDLAAVEERDAMIREYVFLVWSRLLRWAIFRSG